MKLSVTIQHEQSQANSMDVLAILAGGTKYNSIVDAALSIPTKDKSILSLSLDLQ